MFGDDIVSSRLYLGAKLVLPWCNDQSSDILTFLCCRSNNFENLLPKNQVSQLLKGQIDGDINLII